MLHKDEIAGAIAGYLQEQDLFLVDIEVSQENDVTVTVESGNGTVCLDHCVALSEIIGNAFDRDREDYALTVTSAGLDQPFKVLRQYRKFIGKEVEVVLNKGGKIKGILSEADEQKIVLAVSVSVKPEGSKKKVRMETLAEYPFGEFKSCKPVIKFK